MMKFDKSKCIEELTIMGDITDLFIFLNIEEEIEELVANRLEKLEDRLLINYVKENYDDEVFENFGLELK